jgi:hypothetical protein
MHYISYITILIIHTVSVLLNHLYLSLLYCSLYYHSRSFHISSHVSNLGSLFFVESEVFLTMVYNTQNYCVLGLRSLSGILEIREHKVSEIGSASVLR